MNQMGYSGADYVGRPVIGLIEAAPTNLIIHQAFDINMPIARGDAPVWPGHSSIPGLYPAADEKAKSDFPV